MRERWGKTPAAPAATGSEARVVEDDFPALAEQLDKADFEQFERLCLDFRDKSDKEKQKWLENIRESIGTADFPIDSRVHHSRLEAILSGENLAIQKIIRGVLPSPDRIGSEINSAKQSERKSRLPRTGWLEKVVRQNFAARFVALRDLPEIKTFDLLSGAQLARLVRLAGIREVTFACARIESVESLGAFLRRFAPEDARAIAAQLNGLPKIADARVAFAEKMVENALEVHSQPSSAMLDWLGIRLVAIMLCGQTKPALRTVYAEQKLPLETEPTLTETIETQCRRTPDKLKLKIGAEIEALAEMVGGSDANAERGADF